MILDIAREQVLERGVGLDEAQTLRGPAAARRARRRRARRSPTRSGCAGAGPRSRSRASSRSRPAAARRTATSARSRAASRRRCARSGSTSRRWSRPRARRRATGATEFCIVAAVRGPDERLMAQVREGVAGDHATRSTSTSPARSASSPASRATSSPSSASTATTTTSRPPARTSATSSPRTRGRSAGRRCSSCASCGMEVCCGGIIGMGETLEQRAELAAQFAALDPDEVPLNFLDPRPGTPFADLEPVAGAGRAADDRRVPARAAAHDPALRRRARADARRPRRAPGHGRRHQRGDRRQLPDDARPRPAGGPRPARRAVDAGQGAQRRRCEHGGRATASRPTATAAASRSRRATTSAAVRGARDRPAALLHGRAAASSRPGAARPADASARRCVPLPARRAARAGCTASCATIESAQGPKVMLDGREVLLLCSNDYLGLAGDPRVRDAAARSGRAVGRGRGRVAAGVRATWASTASSRQRLAELKGTEACVLFGSGFLANTGVIAALATDGVVLVRRAQPRLDRRRLPARARADASSTRTATSTARDAPDAGRVIVTDAVFSMDGDVAPLPASSSWSTTGARVIVDEAHATGVIGADGRGLVARARARRRGRVIDRHAGQGARQLRRVRLLRRARPPTFLVNRARTLIYSTALPPPSIGAALEALDRCATSRDRRAGCTRNARDAARRRSGCRAQRHADRPAGLRRAGRRRWRRCEAALEQRRLRPGDPPADRPGRHLAAAARGHRRATPRRTCATPRGCWARWRARRGAGSATGCRRHAPRPRRSPAPPGRPPRARWARSGSWSGR